MASDVLMLKACVKTTKQLDFYIVHGDNCKNPKRKTKSNKY